MDLTFQVPMQYCSLQHQTASITSHIYNRDSTQIYNRMWLTLGTKTGQQESQMIRVFIQLKSEKDLFCLTSFSSLGLCGHLSFLHCLYDLIFVYLFKKNTFLWLRSKNLQAINAGEGVEKREPSYTVGGNAN